MKNVSSVKNSKSGPPAGTKNMHRAQPAGSKPMPRVGGHNTNNAGTGVGVKNDEGC